MIDYFAGKRRIEIGKRIAAERRKARMTQSELADRLEKENGGRPKQSTISMWEHGNSFPDSIETVFSLSRIFGCDCGYLLCDYDERTHDASGICDATGLSEETVNTLCNAKTWGVGQELTTVVDALIYDLNHATKGEDISPLIYLISWFLQYNGGGSSAMRVSLNGSFRDCGDVTGHTAGTLKMNSRVIESAALTEIQQSLISLKKRILRKERRNKG